MENVLRRRRSALLRLPRACASWRRKRCGSRASIFARPKRPRPRRVTPPRRSTIRSRAASPSARLANVRYLSGRLEEAVVLYQRALEAFALGDDEIEGAKTRSSALQALILLGRYDDAQSWAGRGARGVRAPRRSTAGGAARLQPRQPAAPARPAPGGAGGLRDLAALLPRARRRSAGDRRGAPQLGGVPDHPRRPSRGARRDSPR